MADEQTFRELIKPEYNEVAYALERRPLNVKKLIEAGAIRVTQPGDGKGGYEQPDDPSKFSLVTLINDLTNPATSSWPNRPESIEAAQQMINAAVDPKIGHLVYDGKYRQILDSAKLLGLKESDIFLDALQSAEEKPAEVIWAEEAAKRVAPKD